MAFTGKSGLSKVLILTTEPLPLPGSATTGAGLRAWGLTEGLRHRGLDVTIASALQGDDEPPALAPGFEHVRFFRRNAIGALLHEVAPDVVVLQHWGLAADVPELSVPLVIDLAGPHLLERLYWGSSDPERDVQEKLAALRRADFVTCSGYYQRHYFYSFLGMAGFDLKNLDFPVIPFSVPPAAQATAPAEGREFTFLYGGAFLAWQDPTRAIRWLLDEMDAAGKGRLRFFGGAHPVLDASGGRFAELLNDLKDHPRVEMRGWKPFDELLQEYQREGDVALDLMAWNPERELAFTTRTMIYVYCGLPVIYNNYSELSQILQRYEAGWMLDPNDEQGFKKIVQHLLAGNSSLAELKQNARRLAADFEWTKTCGPLVEFCRAPQMRRGRVEFALAHERRMHDEAQKTVAPARGAGSEFLSRTRILSRIAAPFVYVGAWLIVLYIRLRLGKSSVKS